MHLRGRGAQFSACVLPQDSFLHAVWGMGVCIAQEEAGADTQTSHAAERVQVIVCFDPPFSSMWCLSLH